MAHNKYTYYPAKTKEERKIFECKEEEVAWVCPVCSYNQTHFEIHSENY